MGSHVGLINEKILVLHTVKVYGVDLISQRYISYLLKSRPSVHQDIFETAGNDKNLRINKKCLRNIIAPPPPPGAKGLHISYMQWFFKLVVQKINNGSESIICLLWWQNKHWFFHNAAFNSKDMQLLVWPWFLTWLS